MQFGKCAYICVSINTKRNKIMQAISMEIKSALSQFEAQFDTANEARWSTQFAHIFVCTSNCGRWLVPVFYLHKDSLNKGKVIPTFPSNLVQPLELVAKALIFDLVSNYLAPITGQELPPADWKNEGLLAKYRR